MVVRVKNLKKKPKKSVRKVKAWVFLADGKDGKYFVTDTEGYSTIFLTKPQNRPNPFVYLTNPKLSRKATPILITFTK
jgi:hypothetical protein